MFDTNPYAPGYMGQPDGMTPMGSQIPPGAGAMAPKPQGGPFAMQPYNSSNAGIANMIRALMGGNQQYLQQMQQRPRPQMPQQPGAPMSLAPPNPGPSGPAMGSPLTGAFGGMPPQGGMGPISVGPPTINGSGLY